MRRWLARTLRDVVRFAQPLVPRDRSGVTILAYHLVGAGTDSPVDLPLDRFQRQLRELLDMADVCSLDDAVRHLQSRAPADRPRVVVTFDDGFDNFRVRAWPTLRALEIPCTFYVPVGFFEGTCPVPLRGVPGLKPIGWSALRDLASDPLITVGSHSWRHGDLRRLDPQALQDDLRHSRSRLEECIGTAVDHFCYPQAKRSATTDTHVRAVYRTAVVAGGRRNVANGFDPCRMWRTPVRRDTPGGLMPIVQSAVWLEEWAASRARALT